MKFLFSFFILAWMAFVSCYNEYEANITFRTFNSECYEFYSTLDNNDTLLANCDPKGNYTVVVHGYGESINSIWPRSLIKEYLNARSGCVFFMDYQ